MLKRRDAHRAVKVVQETRHGAILRTVEGSRMPVLAHAEFARMLGRLRKGGGHALEIELVGSRWRSA